MSFWSQSPGPTWFHWFQSLFVCKEQDVGVMNGSIGKMPRLMKPPSGTQVHELTELNAKDLETLLSQHYQTFPRSKIVLKQDRIREGFLYDGWLGVGVYTGLKLIGCVVSRDLGTLHVAGNEVPRVSYIDFFCVAESWRKKGIASLLLQEIVALTAKKGRLVHVFQKEGMPISPLPPVWQSQYIWRKKGIPGEEKGYIGKEEIGVRSHIRSFNYAECIPYKGSISSVPKQLTGDSEIYSFNYKGYTMNLCITDTFHRSVPEGWRIGEIQWILSKQDVPLNIQQLAIEALVDSCRYEVVLMDSTLPHQKGKGWQKDSPYGYYLFNYNPGQFFSLKPHFLL